MSAQVMYDRSEYRRAEVSRKKPSKRDRLKNFFKNFGENLIRWLDERIVREDPIIKWVVERPSGSIFKSLTENFIGIVAASLIAGIVGGVIWFFVAGLIGYSSLGLGAVLAGTLAGLVFGGIGGGIMGWIIGKLVGSLVELLIEKPINEFAG